MSDESRRLTWRIRCFRCSHLSIARLHEQLQLTVIPVILSPLFRCFLSPPSNFLWCSYTFCSFECKCCTRSFSWRPFNIICSDILSTCWMFFFVLLTFHKCCCLSSSRYRWAALCPFSASRDTWSRAPPPGPASPTWPGAERSPSAFVRRAAPHRRHVRLHLFVPAVQSVPSPPCSPCSPRLQTAGEPAACGRGGDGPAGLWLHPGVRLSAQLLPGRRVRAPSLQERRHLDGEDADMSG